jgi:fimbrial chaperone protein
MSDNRCRSAGRSRLPLLIALVATLIACTSQAGSFQVNPIRVDLDSRATSQSLVVRNDAAEPLIVQLSVQAWQQAEGRDVYSATGDALVTPPIAQIPPGGEQVVRVGLRRPPDASRQLTYRLFVHEVAQPAAAGFSGLQVALRVGIPVFVAPTSRVKRDLHWSALRLPDGSLRLAVENRGNVHLQFVDLALHVPGTDEPVARHQQLAYVLAGQSRAWVLAVGQPASASLRAVRLRAIGDGGEIDVTLPLAP